MKMFLTLLFIIIIFFTVNTQTQATEIQLTPSLNTDRLLFQVAGGVGGGVCLGAAGALMGAFIGCYFEPAVISAITGAFTGFITGYLLGGPLAVYLVGNWGQETASLPVTVGAGLLGGAAGMYFFSSLASKSDLDIFTAIGFLSPPVAATAGFALTRRYKEPRPAFILVKDSKTFQFPILQFIF